MGTSISSMIQLQKDEAKAGLEMLHVLMQGKLEAAKSMIKYNIEHDEGLPMIAVVDTMEKYEGNVNKDSKDWSDEINKVLSDFLTKDPISGVMDCVRMSMDALFEEVTLSEQYVSSFHVLFVNNALVRFDYYGYRYNEDTISWMRDSKGGFCYYLQTAVLDIQKCNPQVVLYELSKSIGGDYDQACDWLQQMTQFGKLLYQSIYDLDKIAKGEVVDDNKDEGVQMLRGSSPSVPPAIREQNLLNNDAGQASNAAGGASGLTRAYRKSDPPARREQNIFLIDDAGQPSNAAGGASGLTRAYRQFADEQAAGADGANTVVARIVRRNGQNIYPTDKYL